MTPGVVPPAAAQLDAGLRQLGLDLDGAQRAALLALLDELAEANARFNLTAIRERGEMVTKHLLDSLTLQRFLAGPRIADIGTGAGFPGLPLAIVNPAWHFTLVESTGKKLRFVAHAAQALGLANVATVNARAEAFRPAQPFDSVTCRAVGSLAEFIRVAGHLCGRGGRLLAMKGRYPESELAALPSGWRAAAVHAVEVPGLDAVRHVVELARVPAR